ncbi:MAG: ribonuclease [Bryobacterales bacterium]|nr:ribonuclease [Bryobacterales bacterium]
MGIPWRLLKAAAFGWNAHNAPRLGAALAYYTVLSTAPLLVLAVAIAGFVFGEQAARGELVYQMQSMVGHDVANVIQELLKSAYHPQRGILATSIGILTLLVGASAVFGELRDALNLIWGYTAPRQSDLKALLRFRLFAFAIVIAVGFLLLVSLVISAILAFVTSFLGGHTALPAYMIAAIEPLISVAVISLLFALIYKYIPDVYVRWEDVWVGSAFTAVLFTVGKVAIGVYLGRAGVGSAYGAAGSIVVLLVWVYYSSQIFFFGAEFTKVYSDWRRGARRTSAV